MDTLRKEYRKVLCSKFSKKDAAHIERVVYERCVHDAEVSRKEPDKTYKNNGFQYIGMLMECGESIVGEISDTSKTYWDFSSFERNKRLQLIDIASQLEGIKMEKCDYKCRNKLCGSMECYYYLSQTRSGDEGMTAFVVCSKCNTRYKAG